MGHAIEYHFLEAKTEKRAMKEGLEFAKNFAYCNVDPYEDPSRSYHGNFKFYNRNFDNEEEAARFFKTYQDGVCLVKKPSNALENKFYERSRKISKKKSDYWNGILEKFIERKSATVGCKKCGTRFSKEAALHNNLLCMNCRNILVADTVKNRLNKFDEEHKTLLEWFREEIRKKRKTYILVQGRSALLRNE